MKGESKSVRAILVTILALLSCASSWCQSEPAHSKLPPGSVQAQANGRIDMLAAAHSPLYVEFDRSGVLSQALATALQARGFAMTKERSDAKATLTIRGDLVRQGGPVFYKGVRVPMGEATEKSFQASAGSRSTTSAEAVQATVSLALETGAAR